MALAGGIVRIQNRRVCRTGSVHGYRCGGAGDRGDTLASSRSSGHLHRPDPCSGDSSQHRLVYRLVCDPFDAPLHDHGSIDRVRPIYPADKLVSEPSLASTTIPGVVPTRKSAGLRARRAVPQFELTLRRSFPARRARTRSSSRTTDVKLGLTRVATRFCHGIHGKGQDGIPR